VGKIKFCIVFALVAIFAVFTPGGCSEEQLQQADRTAADVNALGTLVRDVATSPAGGAIPQPVRLIMELLGVGIVAAYGIWQKMRAAQAAGRSADLSTTLRAIADGVDGAPKQAGTQVKAQIKAVMDNRQVRDLADPIVNEHRSKLSA
jgi:hypothetical protein